MYIFICTQSTLITQIIAYMSHLLSKVVNSGISWAFSSLYLGKVNVGHTIAHMKQ